MALGTYYITLIAETGEGCLDTLTIEKPVMIDGRGRTQISKCHNYYPDDAAEEYYDPGEPDPRIFRPVAEGIEDYKLEIYNRWGELIFISKEVNRGLEWIYQGFTGKTGCLCMEGNSYLQQWKTLC